MYGRRKINIFFELEARDFFAARKSEVQTIIESASAQQLSDEKAFSDGLCRQYRLEPLTLEFDKIRISAREDQIPGEVHPSFDFLVSHMRGKTFPRQVITYHIPFSGAVDLLRCMPNPRVLSAPEVIIEGNEVLFDVIDFYNDADRVKNQADPILNVIRKQADNLQNNVNEYNASLPGFVAGLIGMRKERVKERSKVMEGLGYPVKSPMKETEQHISNRMPVTATPAAQSKQVDPQWDVFICHASEDKEPFVNELAAELGKHVSVWYDDFTLKVGDSLRRSIDKGLALSRFGVVVLSRSFFNKEWPQKELDGLSSRERDGLKVILPVWLDMERDEIVSYSPMLADRIAVKASDGPSQVASKLLSVVKPAVK